MRHSNRAVDAAFDSWRRGVLLVLIAGCVSVPTRETALRARLDTAAAQCAARDTLGGRDTTAIFGAGFEAEGFVRAAPTPRDRFNLDHPGQAVEVEFVVDTAGRADLCLGHVVRESDPGLGDRLLDAASRWTFTPAEFKGRKVRQAIRVVYTSQSAN